MHGDYDVDGVTSTVILRRALELIGANVVHFIPERLKDGYGLQPASVERLHAEGAALVISVDCGIRGMDAARRARELGLDLIITDHHEPDVDLPCAHGGRQPQAPRLPLSRQEPGRRRRGAEAGAGAVRAHQPHEPAAGVREDGRHRHAGRRGAARRREPHHRQAGPGPAVARPAPRRAARADRRVRPDRPRHRQLPHRLRGGAADQRRRPDEQLRHRRAPAAGDRRVDGRGSARAGRDAGQREHAAPAGRGGDRRPGAARSSRPTSRSGRARCIVVAGHGWHRGVIGIVASKLVDAFHRPAIVLSIDGDIAHGSCRSIPSFDLLAGLEACGRRADDVRRAQAGRRRHARGRPHPRVPQRGSTRTPTRCLGPDDLRPRLWIDGPLRVPGHHRPGHRRAGQPGAVRRRESRRRCFDQRAWRSSTGRGGSRSGT